MNLEAGVMRTDLEQAYASNGFVHLPGFLTAEEVAELLAAVESAPERHADSNPLTLDTMRFASNLFYGSSVLRDFLASRRVVELVTRLCGPDAWVRWDQAVWKGPGAPEFPWHQDNGYTGLNAVHLQLWVALTHSRPENGGLVVEPGGHRAALRPHHWRGHHVELDTVAGALPIEAAPGDVVVFSSLLPHATAPNVTTETRVAYVAEFLPVSVPDRQVEAPHFRISERGAATGRFVDLDELWPPAG